MKKLLCISFALTVCFMVAGQTPALKFQEGSVWITGLGKATIEEDQWANMFRVYTQEALDKRVNQPVAGSYVRYGDSLSFTPDFKFATGGKYRALFGKLELSFAIPKEKSSPTRIECVHPQAYALPENMLRMYISFSGPMMPGEAYDHIALRRQDGTLVEKAFLIIDQELWDAERKRFTLLFDPGRVKRGIQSNVELGAPLQAGETYQLVIDPNWRDAHGNSLESGYTKSFTVTAAERTKLSIDLWKITAPVAGTQEDLLIEFDRPIDYALAMKVITIRGTQGQVRGNVALISSNLWRFTPDQPWPEDEYQLEVYPQLEDVAGNNSNNAFDIDLSKERRVTSSESLKYSFSTRPLVK